MKILCTADWHIGKKLEAFSRLEEQKEILQQIIDIAEQEMVDAVIVAGDCFDTQNPTPEMAKLFVQTLANLSRNGQCLVLVIAGNHDNPLFLSVSEAFASQVGVVIVGYPQDIPQLELNNTMWQILNQDVGMIEILFKKRKKTIRFLLTPYANAQRLKKDLGVDDTDKKAWDILCNQWEKSISHDEETINILVTHYFVQPDKKGLYQDELLEEDDSERSIVGTIGAMPIDTIPEGIDYMILGHIHRPYFLYSQKNIKSFYTGSPLYYSQKETSHSKSVLILDLSRKKTEYRVPLDVKRTIKTIQFDNFETIFDLLQREYENYLILIWEGDYYFTSEQNKSLREAHPRILRIDPCLKNQSINNDFSELQKIETQDPKELFVEYFCSKNKGQRPAEDLLEVFSEILAEEKENTQLIRKRGFYPKKITIKGFYSYKNQIEIDFSLFSGKHFFGIFGAVGSGKSALIEAIVFALFGKTQRFGSISSSNPRGNFSTKYGMMNLECSDMLIEFNFEIIGENNTLEEYCSRITGTRKKKNTDIDIKQEFLIKKHNQFEPFECDPKKAGEEILGIEYNDFCKTIILQQRDFLGFLSLQRTEQADTLMRLFQLERFDLSEPVNSMSASSYNKINNLQGRLKELPIVTNDELDEFQQKYDALQDQIKNDQEELEKKIKEKTQLEQFKQQFERFQELQEKYSLLLTEEETFHKAKIRNNTQRLIEYIDSIQNLQKKEKELLNQQEELLQKTKNNEKKLSTLKTELQNFNLEFEQLKNQRQDDYNQQKILSDVSEYDCIPFYESNINNIYHHLDKCTRIDEQILELEKKSKTKGVLVSELKKHEEQEQLLRQNIDVQSLLPYLQKHMPCPLCGSLEHPNPYKGSASSGDLELTIQNIDRIKNEYNIAIAAENKIVELSQEKNELKNQIKKYLGEYHTVELLQKECQVLKEKQYNRKQLLAELDQKINDNDLLIHKKERDKESYFDNIKNIEQEQAVLQSQLEDLKKNIREVMNEIQDKTQLKDQEITNLNITKEQFLEIRHYPEKNKEEIDEFFINKAKIEGELSSLSQYNWDNDSIEKLSNLSIELSRLKEETDSSKKQLGLLLGEIEHAKSNNKKRESLNQELDLLMNRHNNLQMLTNLFRGKGFVSFIGQKYLNKLCHSANLRFLKFTQNQFELAPPDDTNKSVICLIDRLSGGAKRDIATLSGGQSFQAALALALALSDESGAGHRFFFIDEGFGSLDDDNLHLVLETLRNLSKEENRLVGLISHVPMIKDEVDICLNVFRNSLDGSIIEFSE